MSTGNAWMAEIQIYQLLFFEYYFSSDKYLGCPSEF